MTPLSRARWIFAVVALLAATAPAARASQTVRIVVLSNRADLVSGGDALVAIYSNSPTPLRSATIKLNTADVSSAFARRQNGQFEGLLTGLAVGPNSLVVTMPDATGAKITITNHPIGGPVFAGAQVQPWICTTAANGLGNPTDAACNAPSKTSFVFKNATTGQFDAYDPNNPPAPSMVASTTTDQGVTVPYIVRTERGTLDRSIYDVAVLFDPTKPWSPWAPQKGWNHKLTIPFGGGCNSHHSQDPPGSVLDDHALGRGYAVATSGLNALEQDCNTATSAEAVMMMKEHITETYGDIAFTFGTGGSGGSIQQHQIASTYPGLLDGIIPSASFADVWTTAREVSECAMLLHYFTQTSPQLWASTLQQSRVMGTGPTDSTCAAWVATFANRLDPTVAANCNLPADQVYSPTTNPHGVRCAIQDYQPAVWGGRSSDGFSRRPLDNVGVQYGLRALESNEITPEQFVDLNDKVGGQSIDAVFTSARSVADPGAAAAAYTSGQVTNGMNLAKVPIIDLRGMDSYEIHTDYHSHALRERLLKANGTAANQIIWTGVVPLVGDASFGTIAFDLMDSWLTAIKSDHRAIPLRQKVIVDKPAAAVDACWVAGQKITDTSVCGAITPYFGDAQIAAGGSLAGDVMKCQLKALNRADYATGTFSEDQWARLQTAFPTGVCDWRVAGVGQQAPITWPTFETTPGGSPLPPAPVSVSF